MLFIDDRSGSNELVPYLSDPDTCVCRLNSGDVAFAGNGPSGDIMVGIEVKKVPDLLSSESTGRLAATQLPRLLMDYQEIYLLVIGNYRPGSDGTLQVERGNHWTNYRVGNRVVPYAYIEGFIIELQATGVGFGRVENNREAAWWIRTCEHWWSKPWDKHRAMKKFDNSGPALMPGDENDPEYRRLKAMANVMKGLPNMGWERAWAAARHFDSLGDAFSATVKEWSEIDGIGFTIADRVVETIHGRKQW